MAEPTVQQLVDMYANVPRTEVEMEGAVVRGQIPKPVYRDGVNLDVSMVGDKFVHIGKLSELAAIDEAFAPKDSYLARQVPPSIYAGEIKDNYEEMKKAKKEEDYNELRTNILTPVGGGAFLVAGVSAGKDSEGNDIPIIVYKDEEIGVRGIRSGPTTYAYPYKSQRKDYFSINTEGHGAFSHNYVIPRSKIVDYPFDPSVNVGLEASRNYGQDFSERIAPEPIPPPPVLAPMPPPAAMPVELDEPTMYDRPYRSPFRTMYRKGN